MAHITNEIIHATLPAMLPNGQTFEFTATIKKQNAYYKVESVTTLIDAHEYHIVLAIVCKSSKDIGILSNILRLANTTNECILKSITTSAEYFGTSRKNLNELLNRAVDASLLHKIATGHYFINPFLYMSKSAAGESNYQQQELIQARWRETTGLLSAQDIEQLHALSKYLDQPVILPGTEFNLSVAYYYSKHNTITAKQIAAYKKRAIITANWSPNGSIYNQP